MKTQLQSYILGKFLPTTMKRKWKNHYKNLFSLTETLLALNKTLIIGCILRALVQFWLLVKQFSIGCFLILSP